MRGMINSMVSLIEIFWTFFKISSVTFGGGMAMLPILQRDIVQSKLWVTDEELIDFYAISQGLPGIIAINVAAFIGFRKRGALGVIAASLGIAGPCILIITILASILDKFQDMRIVKNSFAGITIGVTALIFNSVVSLWKKSILDKLCVLLFFTTVALVIFTNLSPVVFVVLGAFIGIIVKNIGDKI